jgi:hypothetical protein
MVDWRPHSCCFWSSGEEGSVKLWVVVMQQPVLLSPKFEMKPSHIFTQLPQKVTIICRTDCLACQDEFFVNNPLDVKENDEHALHLSRLFRSRWIWTLPLVGLLLCLRVQLSSSLTTPNKKVPSSLSFCSIPKSHQARHMTSNKRT